MWIPLDDLSREETFHFYPDYFSKSVPNNSEIFNYAHWVKDGWDLKIGWQNKEENQKHNAQFPKLTGGFDRDHIIDFECKASQILLFSGAQFHQTFNQLTHKTRFSLDLRIAYLPDVERQHGAPNCDNRSRGSSVKDYFACVL